MNSMHKTDQSLAHRVIVVFFVMFMVAMFVLIPPQRAEALTPLIPFGGLSLSVTPCPCSFSLLITVGPPLGGSFIYTPGAMLYLFGQIFRPGVWLLGLAAPAPVPCVIFVPSPPWCVPIAWGLPILMVGTSM